MTPLDEWIKFLKSGKIDEDTKVEGLRLARRQLRMSSLSREERMAYERHIENRRIQWDVLNTARDEGLAEGRAEGRAEAIYDVVRNMKSQGLPVELIAKTTGLSREDIDKL